jgi:hypothetical protein
VSHIRRDAAYLKNPNFCPFCKSDEIDASFLERRSFEDTVYQWVRCDTCETEWHNIYELTGYEEVVTGDVATIIDRTYDAPK